MPKLFSKVLCRYHKTKSGKVSGSSPPRVTVEARDASPPPRQLSTPQASDPERATSDPGAAATATAGKSFWQKIRSCKQKQRSSSEKELQQPQYTWTGQGKQQQLLQQPPRGVDDRHPPPSDSEPQSVSSLAHLRAPEEQVPQRPRTPPLPGGDGAWLPPPPLSFSSNSSTSLPEHMPGAAHPPQPRSPPAQRPGLPAPFSRHVVLQAPPPPLVKQQQPPVVANGEPQQRPSSRPEPAERVLPLPQPPKCSSMQLPQLWPDMRPSSPPSSPPPPQPHTPPQPQQLEKPGVSFGQDVRLAALRKTPEPLQSTAAVVPSAAVASPRHSVQRKTSSHTHRTCSFSHGSCFPHLAVQVANGGGSAQRSRGHHPRHFHLLHGAGGFWCRHGKMETSPAALARVQARMLRYLRTIGQARPEVPAGTQMKCWWCHRNFPAQRRFDPVALVEHIAAHVMPYLAPQLVPPEYFAWEFKFCKKFVVGS